jgi:hypothetical protein
MIAQRISHYRIVSKLGADGMGEGYQAPNSIATLRVGVCRPGTLSARFDLTGLLKVVGAWGLEPQTPTVSRQRSTFQKPNRIEGFLIFALQTDQLPDQLLFVSCYSLFSSTSPFCVKPQTHSTSRGPQ